MWDIFGERMLGANCCYADIRGFASFRKGIIARVKVLAFLMRHIRHTERVGWVAPLIGC